MDDPDGLRRALQTLHAKLRAEMKSRWSRDLPFDELLGDRWERARELGFGERTSIYQNSYVFGDVAIGKNTWIGPFTMLDGSGGGIQIGDHCSISTGVHIYTHDTVKWALSGGTAAPEKAPVRIGDCSYIGPNTIVTKGVTIGDHVVIGAGSLVNKDVPPYTVAFGTPCRAIRKVERADME